MKEIWKDIPGYEGKYQASNLGRIKSLNYNLTGKEWIMTPFFNKDGYKNVGLRGNGRRKFFLVHRLIWMAFNGVIPDGMEINHINEDKTDNRLSNLNLLSHKENCMWGTRNKRVSIKNTNGKCSKWVIKLSKNNEIIHFYPSTMQAQKETGIWRGNISGVCRGEHKSAGGFIWKYVE